MMKRETQSGSAYFLFFKFLFVVRVKDLIFNRDRSKPANPGPAPQGQEK